MFKAKRHRKKGSQLPQPGALITSADNSWPPPLPFHIAQKFLSRTYSHFTNMSHPYEHTHSHDTHTHTLTHSLTHTLTKTKTYIKSVNMCGWGIFGAVWKGRGGDQELSAEVIRAPGWGSWSPQSFFFKSFSHFSAGTLLFLATPKILHAEVR